MTIGNIEWKTCQFIVNLLGNMMLKYFSYTETFQDDNRNLAYSAVEIIHLQLKPLQYRYIAIASTPRMENLFVPGTHYHS